MPFELQGHRGACGLKPENTLPSFEAALNAGVTSIETDIHLTRDGVPVLCHDAVLNDTVSEVLPGHGELLLPVSRMTLTELRCFVVARNPDPERFPQQDAANNPLADFFAIANSIHPYTVPTLAEFFSFVECYAQGGEGSGWISPEQRDYARKLRFDLELKRVPFEPDTIGDDFDGAAPGLLERRVVEEALKAGVVERTVVRSFDHRSVRAIKRLEPRLTTAVVIGDTIPISPVTLAREAGATIYCPNYRFVDETLVRLAHADGLRVITWTVNRPEDWERLIRWGVDGITTDYPDRLRAWLEARNIAIL